MEIFTLEQFYKLPIEKKCSLVTFNGVFLASRNLKKRKNVIKGDPHDLINLTWEKEINLDLP